MAIRRAISKPPMQGKNARPAFVVQGDLPEAVHEAYMVLVDDKKPREVIPKGLTASVVFFSSDFGRYVHLRSVERHDNDIDIKYEFVPHKSKEVTAHFAIIPLDKLPSGTMRVNIAQAPMSAEFASGWKPIIDDTARCIVSNSFSFVVK